MINTTLEQRLIIDAVEVANQFEKSFTEEQGIMFADQNPVLFNKLKEVFNRLEKYSNLCKYASTMTISGNDILNSIKRSEKASGRIH